MSESEVNETDWEVLCLCPESTSFSRGKYSNDEKSLKWHWSIYKGVHSNKVLQSSIQQFTLLSLSDTLETGGGQNTDPQSMDYPDELPIWTIL